MQVLSSGQDSEELQQASPVATVRALRGVLSDKTVRLFVILAGFFVSNAIFAEFIGYKIFSLENTLGIDPIRWNLFGQGGELQFSAGVLIWPFVFILTDVINDYFGVRGVKMLSFMTVGLLLYGFMVVYMAIGLAPASWWPAQAADRGVPDLQSAFSVVYGQGLWLIVGSVTAFLIGQLLDASIFKWIKGLTGDRYVWLRATGSTLIGQLIDSYIVLYIAFVLGPPKWGFGLFFAVGTVNFAYKLLMAILLIPALYGVHALIEKYLGASKATALRMQAVRNS